MTPLMERPMFSGVAVENAGITLGEAAVRDQALPFRNDYADHDTDTLVLQVNAVDKHLPDFRVGR
jgi:hypothetical protein